MATNTWLYIALGAAGVYAIAKLRKPKPLITSVVAEMHPIPPGAGKEQPAFCEEPHAFEDKANALQESFERAWDTFGLEPGGFDGMADAREKSHRVALYVMQDVCPQLPRPTNRTSIPNYIQKYGEAWRIAYDTPYGYAWARLVQMPV